jgi:hypothetical protein
MNNTSGLGTNLSRDSRPAPRRIIQVIINSFFKLKTPRSEDRGASDNTKLLFRYYILHLTDRER